MEMNIKLGDQYGKPVAKAPDEWEIKHWADTILSAEEIKNDPMKMKYVTPFLNKKVDAIKSLDDLKAKARRMTSKAPAVSDDEEPEVSTVEEHGATIMV